ncbi:MAG TPA: glycosyltransferase family 2 protein [Terriglobales bacterium]|jgi:dolichol-phosphate mannosyltransferase|nr:glycosyltransferase family 2 protein [Terriglobales bacterium]
MITAQPVLEVLLPVHNEAESIAATIGEIYDTLSPRIPLRFIICEDGSTDDTKNVLTRLSQTFPIRLIMSEERKGYSRAVIDGMKSLQADYLLCLDSDGQCDPKDFWKFWDGRNHQAVTIGQRVCRSDNLLRKTMSRVFYTIYQLLYHVPVHDPSCPYVLANKQVIDSVVSELGAMKQGFWWEFIARVHRRGFSIREVPVNHRNRTAGTTRVYRLTKLPVIAGQHLAALFKVWFQTRGK